MPLSESLQSEWVQILHKENLRASMDKNGILTMTELVQRTGVARETMRRMNAGGQVSQAAVAKIATTLQVHPSLLARWSR